MFKFKMFERNGSKYILLSLRQLNPSGSFIANVRKEGEDINWDISMTEKEYNDAQECTFAPINRLYAREIPPWANVMTVEEWKESIRTGELTPIDGTGRWCKGGKESPDHVFNTNQGDATHVAWYNV